MATPPWGCGERYVWRIIPKAMAVRIIRWVRQWGGTDRVVWINVAKLDAAWRFAEPNSYIASADIASADRMPDNGSIYRYTGFGEWLASARQRVWMPHICVYAGGVSFTDARHRFSWCRDHGVKALPVSAHPSDAREIAKRYGSKSRTCRVPVRCDTS